MRKEWLKRATSGLKTRYSLANSTFWLSSLALCSDGLAVLGYQNCSSFSRSLLIVALPPLPCSHRLPLCSHRVCGRPECDGVVPNKVPGCSNVSCLDPMTCVDEYIAANWIGDNYCDTSLNCAMHDWDGGDCDTGSQTPAPSPPSGGTCQNFSCLSETQCVDVLVLEYNWVGDNYCDHDLNCAAFDFDGGDCETETPSECR